MRGSKDEFITGIIDHPHYHLDEIYGPPGGTLGVIVRIFPERSNWGERLIVRSTIGQLRVPDWIKWRKQGQHQPSSLSFLTVDAMWPTTTCLCHHSLPWNAGPRPHTGSQKKIAPLSLCHSNYRKLTETIDIEREIMDMSLRKIILIWVGIIWSVFES